jgi:multiple sugar transport system substrate-binding protein
MIDKCAARRQRLVKIAIAVGVTVAFATTACSSSGGGSPTGGGASAATQSDIAAALQKDTTITFWGWAPQTQTSSSRDGVVVETYACASW